MDSSYIIILLLSRATYALYLILPSSIFFQGINLLSHWVLNIEYICSTVNKRYDWIIVVDIIADYSPGIELNTSFFSTPGWRWLRLYNYVHNNCNTILLFVGCLLRYCFRSNSCTNSVYSISHSICTSHTECCTIGQMLKQ